MPNDAKLGLVVGVGLVITVAVLFFREDGHPVPRLNRFNHGLPPDFCNFV